MKFINPEFDREAGSKYSQGIKLKGEKRRLVISGQVGMKPDGTMEKTTREQMERAFSNLFAVLKEAGFEKTHLVKITIFVTEPGQTATYREIRDRVMDGHRCAPRPTCRSQASPCPR